MTCVALFQVQHGGCGSRARARAAGRGVGHHASHGSWQLEEQTAAVRSCSAAALDRWLPEFTVLSDQDRFGWAFCSCPCCGDEMGLATPALVT
jgi:hypothetical protein